MTVHLVAAWTTGLAVFVAATIWWRTGRERQGRPDRASPYSDAVHAAVRLQRAAHDAEAVMRIERARHADLFRETED